jgi:hypothetical protein
MTSDTRLQYADAYKEFLKLKAQANETVQMVYKIGQQLNQQPTVGVFQTPGAPPPTDGRTLFNPADWPSCEALQGMIKSWMDSKANLDKIWATLPEAERAGLATPPDLRLSVKS